MNRPSRNAFLALILTQAAHSTEEYFARLYAVLAPARFVSGLLFGDPRIGFVIFNASLVAFGLWCFFGPVRHGRQSAAALAWCWVVLEVLNGAAHVIWSTSVVGYRPGLVTAPVLVVIALVLARALRHAHATTKEAA
ncbi:MAG: hypothetical protein ABI592_08185 [Acidobacteriota bacterium]